MERSLPALEHTSVCRSTGVLFIERSVVVLKMNVSAFQL